MSSAGRLYKKEGSYYTPSHIADIILDIAGYDASHDIVSKYVIDSAAGDGAIIIKVVERYIKAAQTAGLSSDEIAEHIAEHLYAYELNSTELEKCKTRVCDVARGNGIDLSVADLIHFKAGNAFELYIGDASKFDFVIGNPPYVRIHNLDEKPKSKYIDGMCDLFYPFFDIGQQLLNDDGVLCYIAPSSWFTSKAGKNMREDLKNRQCISAVLDFRHYQVFAPYATAYTAIVRIETKATDKVNIYTYDSGGIGIKREEDFDKCWVNGLFMPGAPPWIADVLSATGNIRVANGYATNLDRVFITKDNISSSLRGNGIERFVIKASICQRYKMIYPYDENGQLLSFDQIKQDDPKAASILEANKQGLLERTQVDPDRWWAFGRSQGIADTFIDKVALQGLVKPGEEIRVVTAESGCGVYGGVYVVGMDEKSIKEAANSEELFAYAAALRKYKSGGYYALGGKDIEKFLNWWAKKY